MMLNHAMSAFITVDGLGWRPFMAGLLTVVLGVIVLMGSIWLIIGTNTGFRLGMLISLAGFFGWMFIMGLSWWLYGIGLVGANPTWEVMEVNRGDLGQAAFEDARDLSDWIDLPASKGSRGEAQATVDAFLAEVNEYPVDADAGASYVVLDQAFEIGGKEPRAADANAIERIVWKAKSMTVNWRHPPHYALIQVQAADPATLILRPGEAPPRKVADETQPVTSLILVRNLGDKRFPPALVTIGSLILFAVCCQMLHTRDRREAENRAALVPA